MRTKELLGIKTIECKDNVMTLTFKDLTNLKMFLEYLEGRD